MKALRFWTAVCAGLVFGSGLVRSGMTNPLRVLGFLDVFGIWDPSLAVVMAAAIAAAAPALFYIRKRHRTLLGEPATLPDRRRIDASLIAGSLVFGVGWGLVGICPGPGLVITAAGNLKALVFVAAMALGMTGARLLLRAKGGASPGATTSARGAIGR